jgi:hypothetical protein
MRSSLSCKEDGASDHEIKRRCSSDKPVLGTTAHIHHMHCEQVDARSESKWRPNGVNRRDAARVMDL